MPGLALAQSHPAWWTYASPEATALVGIRWENLRSSVLGSAVGAELSKEGSLSFPDLECLQQAQQVLLSSPAFLAVAYGDFPTLTLREQALQNGFKAVPYHGLTLWVAAGRGAMSVVKLNEHILLVGARKTLEEAVDRSQLETGRQYSPLLARAARFVQHDFWVVAAQIPDPLASLFVPFEVEAGGFDGAVSVDHGLRLDAALTAGSEDAAARIAEQLRRTLPALPEIARGIQIEATGGSVSLSLEIDEQQLAAGLRHQAPAPAVAALPAPVEQPSSPKPAQRQVIRILGLDDGPREIELPAPKEF